VFVDLASSGVGLAIVNLAKEKNVVNLNSARRRPISPARSVRRTRALVYDTWMLANGTGKALVKSGGDSWFFLTADYAFATRWSATPPRWSPPMAQGARRRQASAQQCRLLLLPAAGAKLQGQDIGLANAGGDTTNAIKQAAEFGIVSGGQKLAGMLLFITDVNALGLKVAQGLNFTETFYGT